MEKLRFGVFPGFKGHTTLLLWSDNGGLSQLHELLRGLAAGRLKAVRFEDMPWAESFDGTTLQMSVVPEHDELIEFSKAGGDGRVDWRCSAEQLAEWADLVEVLVPASCKTGHQYLPTSKPHSLQIIVAKGEYGANGVAHGSRKDN